MKDIMRGSNEMHIFDKDQIKVITGVDMSFSKLL